MEGDQEFSPNHDELSDDKKKKRCDLQRCPFCPITTTTLNRHLRLVHSVSDVRKRPTLKVGKKLSCKLCQKEVSQFPSHIKVYHRIDRKSSLYKHILQLARYGFNQGDPTEVTSDSSSEREPEYEEMVCNFGKYLQELEGGQKPEGTAENHKRQVRFILSNAGIGVLRDLSPLMEKDGCLYKQWKEPATGKRAWRVGTLMSYLYSLNMFLDYCKAKDKYLERDKCEEGQAKVARWLKVLSLEAKKREFEYQEEEEKLLLSQNDVQRFYTCESHQKAVDLLNSIEKANQVTMIDQSSVYMIRTDIILWLLLENGQRSGAFVNATLDEFHEATLKDGQWVMRVKGHKTYTTYGPCNVVITPDIHKHLCTWVNIIRPALAAKVPEEERTIEDNTRLFVGFNGKALKVQSHGSQLEKYAKQAIGVSKVNASRIRRSFVVMLNELGSTESELLEVADHFTHSRKTQERYYNIRKSVHKSLRATAAIRNLSQPATSKDASMPSPTTQTKPPAGTGVWTVHSKESLTQLTQTTASRCSPSPTKGTSQLPTYIIPDTNTGGQTLLSQESPTISVRNQSKTDLHEDTSAGDTTLDSQKSLTISRILPTEDPCVLHATRGEPQRGSCLDTSVDDRIVLTQEPPSTFTTASSNDPLLLQHADKRDASESPQDTSTTGRILHSLDSHTGPKNEHKEACANYSTDTDDEGLLLHYKSDQQSAPSMSSTGPTASDNQSESSTRSIWAKSSLNENKETDNNTSKPRDVSAPHTPPITLRNPWNPHQAKLLFQAVKPYLENCIKTGYLPKLPDVYSALLTHNLLYIMEQNGRQRTMEKVRVEFKKMKKRGS